MRAWIAGIAASVVLAAGAAPVAAQEARDDAVWEQYHAAFAALADGRADAARDSLRALAAQHPAHPAALRARELLVALGEAAQDDDGGFFGAEVDPHAPEVRSRGARAELALFQTVHGIAVGIEACVLVDCDDGVTGVFLALAGGGAGLGASLLATPDGIEPGRRGAIDSGVAWGAYNAAMFGIAGDLDDSELPLLLLGSQAAGLAAGEVLWRATRVRDGQVALVNSFGVWSTVSTLFVLGLSDADFDADSALVMTAAGTDAGLIAGGFAAWKFPMSRSRTLIIDAGGIVGALGGMGTAVLIGGDDPGQRLVSGLGLAGTVLGLSAGTYFTRDWDPDAPSPSTQLTLSPLDGGGFAAGLRWQLD